LRRRAKAIAVAALVGSLPVWLPFTCPIQRLFTTTGKRALIELKNRTKQPTPEDYDPRATLAAFLEPGPDRERWSEHRAARLEGYVVAAETAGAELANCLSLTRRDTHIDIALAPGAAPSERLVLEVTPPMRDWARANGLDWSVDALRTLVGKRVRFEGWLLFDWEHDEESEHSRPGQPGNWRATAWEVHPVTSIELLE